MIFQASFKVHDYHFLWHTKQEVLAYFPVGPIISFNPGHCTVARFSLASSLTRLDTQSHFTSLPLYHNYYHNLALSGQQITHQESFKCSKTASLKWFLAFSSVITGILVHPR